MFMCCCCISHRFPLDMHKKECFMFQHLLRRPLDTWKITILSQSAAKNAEQTSLTCVLFTIKTLGLFFLLGNILSIPRRVF